MRDKQPQRSPEAQLHAPRLADWGPTTETPAGPPHLTPGGRPHLKPRVGVHPEQRLAAPHTGPRQQTARCVLYLGPEQTSRQARPRPKAADRLMNSLAACKGTHLKPPVLNNSYLALVHRALQPLLAL